MSKFLAGLRVVMGERYKFAMFLAWVTWEHFPEPLYLGTEQFWRDKARREMQRIDRQEAI